MSLVAVASAKSSPGATTLALALGLAWPAAEDRQSLVVEADPDGGVLAARLGLRVHVSLADVAAEGRRGIDDETLARHSLHIEDSDLWLLLAPGAGEVATAVVATAADRLASHLSSGSSYGAIVDVGRVSTRSPALPLARTADTTLLVTRPTFDELVVVQARVRALEAAGCDVAIVCVGDAPYPPAELCEAADAPLAAVLPDDRRVAAAVAHGAVESRAVRRSAWWRSVGQLAETLASAETEAAL